MGFQFNSVGGGTKTRRPIALHMTYNPACQEPACFLVGEDMQERAMSLEQLQVRVQESVKLQPVHINHALGSCCCNKSRVNVIESLLSSVEYAISFLAHNESF